MREAEYIGTGLIRMGEKLYTMEYFDDHPKLKNPHNAEGWMSGFEDDEVIIVKTTVFDERGLLIAVEEV